MFETIVIILFNTNVNNGKSNILIITFLLFVFMTKNNFRLQFNIIFLTNLIYFNF